MTATGRGKERSEVYWVGGGMEEERVLFGGGEEERSSEGEELYQVPTRLFLMTAANLI